MEFLIDLGASGALVQWLIDAGHDVVQVLDEDARMADSDILQWATQQGWSLGDSCGGVCDHGGTGRYMVDKESFGLGAMVEGVAGVYEACLEGRWEG